MESEKYPSHSEEAMMPLTQNPEGGVKTGPGTNHDNKKEGLSSTKTNDGYGPEGAVLELSSSTEKWKMRDEELRYFAAKAKKRSGRYPQEELSMCIKNVLAESGIDRQPWIDDMTDQITQFLTEER